MFRMAEFKLGDFDFQRGLKAMGALSWRPGMPLGPDRSRIGQPVGLQRRGLRRYGVRSPASPIRDKCTRTRTSAIRACASKGSCSTHRLGNREALQVRIVLQAMGLKELKLAMDCSRDGGSRQGRGRRRSLRHQRPRLGEIDLRCKLVRADPPFWQAIDEGNSLALLRSKAGLGSARIVVVDRGLVERSVKGLATTTGQAPAAVRTAFAQEIRRYQPPGVLITEDISKLLDTAAGFIKRGGTFTLEAKPPKPYRHRQGAVFQPARPRPGRCARPFGDAVAFVIIGNGTRF